MALAPEQLRCLVQDCTAKHLYATAVFYADKLVTLTDYAPGDVYLLAQTYFVSRQFRRGVLLLQQHGDMDDARFRYLAAKCLAAVEDWDEVLSLLGDVDSTLDDEDLQEQQRQHGYDISTHAAVCLLRGQAFEALDSRQRAISCFMAALRADPFCEEAFSALVEHHMLTNAQELELLDSLAFKPEDRWLALLYRSRCKKYLQHDVMEAQLAELQQQPDSSGAADMAAEPPSPSQQQPAAPPGSQHSHTPGQLDAGAGVSTPPPGAAGPCTPGAGLPGAPGPGCGLGSNADVLAARAEWLLHQGRCEDAYQLTSAVLAQDPYATQALTTHLSAALQLGKKNELFLRAHKLVEAYPDSALAWFGVGCYYMAARQFEAARRFFGKATQLDRHSAVAWVCFAHAFAEQDESDQALAAYRTAARLFPGLHTPLLGMGCAYTRMNNLHLGERCLLQAAAMCPHDPAVAHELGVLAYRNRQYAAAAEWFSRALELLPARKPGPAWEATLVNLAHCRRKQQRYAEALRLYADAAALNPHNATSHAGLAFTQQLLGNSAAAVEGYHAALALRPDDAFAGEMLGVALQEEVARFGHELVEVDAGGGECLL